MKISEFAEKYKIDGTEAVCAVSALVGKELGIDDEFELNESMAKELSDFLGIEVNPEGNGSEAKASDEKPQPTQSDEDVSKESSDSLAEKGAVPKQDKEEAQEKAVKSKGKKEKEDLQQDATHAEGEREAQPRDKDEIVEEKEEKTAQAGEAKEKEAEPPPKEMEGDKSDSKGGEETEEEPKGTKEKPEVESDGSTGENREAPLKGPGKENGEDKKEIKTESVSGKGSRAEIDIKREGAEKTQGKNEEKMPEEEAGQGPSDEEGKQVSMDAGKNLDGEKKISGQEEGSPHQEESTGKQGEEEQEPAGTANEDVEGGDKDVPEVVGDERAALLGDNPAAPDSSQKQEEEKISAAPEKKEEAKILLKEGEDIEVKEKVVDIEVDGEKPSEKTVPVETIEDVAEKKEYVSAAIPKPVLISLFVAIGLSIALLIFGFVKLFSAPKASEEPKQIVSQPMSEAELFALLYKMVDKGDLSSAEDFFGSIKDKLGSKFLDDAIKHIAEAYFKRAQSQSDKNYYEKAIEFYSRLYSTTQDPAYKQQALLRQAQAYQGLGDVHNSLKFYRDFLQEFAYSREAEDVQFSIGELLHNMGNNAQALIELWKLIGKYPKSKKVPRAYKIIASIYKSQGRYKELRDVCRTFLSAFPKHKYRGEMYLTYGEALLKLREYKKAVEALKKGKGLLKDEEMSALLEFRLGEALLKSGDPDAAIKEYDFLSKKYKYSKYAPKSMLEIARILDAQGLHNKAIEAYYQFKERFYDSELVPLGIEEMSMVLARQGRFKEAANWLKDIVSHYPRYERLGPVKWKLARTLELMGRYNEAVGIYDGLLKELHMPQDAEAIKKIYIAKAEALLRAKKYKDAVGAYIELIERFKETKGIDRSKIYYRMSVAYFYAGEYAKAEHTLKDAIVFSALSPWRFWCRYLLGRTYEAVGDINPAIKNYIRVTNNKFLGDYRLKSAAFFALGRVYFKTGQYDEALKAFKQAGALSHNWDKQTELIKWQADCYIEKKEYSSAFNAYSRYLDRLLKKNHCEIKGKRSSADLLCEEQIGEEAFASIMYAVSKIADMFFLRGDIKGALNVYSKIESIYKKAELPVPDWILYQKAMCYKKQGENDKARAYFEEVKKLYPGSYWAKEADWNLNEMAIKGKLESAKELVKELSS